MNVFGQRRKLSGHHITNDRPKAMKWWNGLKGDKRKEIVDFYMRGREHRSLTGREIQEIHLKVINR